MPTRQFRSDDTASSPWTWRYGTGASGNTTLTSTIDTSSINQYFTWTGTSGTTTGTANTTVPVGPCMLIQMFNGSATNWEFNYVTVSSSTPTLQYPQTNTYASPSQLITFNFYNNYTINSGGTLNIYTWTGTIGGIGIIFCNNVFTLNSGGTINMNGGGFGGGSGGTSSQGGLAGQSYTGNATDRTIRTANGGGGGGGQETNTADSAGGGGGAGYNGVGTAGQIGGGASAHTPGNAGSSYGVAALTQFYLGSGGGQGGSSASGSVVGSAGGTGGAGLIIVSRQIVINGGAFTLNGNNGTAISGLNGAGGAGSGGALLLKGQQITLSNVITATGGTGGAGSAGRSGGGNGSSGFIHADYAVSISGSTNPTIDTRQDFSLLDPGPMFFVT